LDRSWLGRAELEPAEDAVAGGYSTWRLTYHAGRYGLDDGGSIRVARRSVSDEEDPQFRDPAGSGYTTVTASRDVRLEKFFSHRCHIRPFRAALQVDINDGSLSEDDTISVVYGDRSRGSPGIRNQSFREEEHVFQVLVDPFGAGLFEELEHSPSIRIIGGPVSSIDLAAPSWAVAGTPVFVVVRALDSFGNRSDGYRGEVTVTAEGRVQEVYAFKEKDLGAHRFTLTLTEHGLQRLAVSDGCFTAESNPVEVMNRPPRYRLFWGDMHGQTKQTVGTGTLDEYFSFLRDVAHLNFGGWQGNDFQVTDELWREVKEKTRKYHEPGRFVTFLGYEWSGLTPAGGDHNIYFLGDEEEIHRSDHWQIPDKSGAPTDRYPINELWKEFKGRRDVMAVAHVGGRHANLDYWDPERVPLIEVHSHHGTFEWLLEEALDRGLKVGFIAASDDHTCRPGLTLPSGGFTTRGGYTGVYAKELTRDALWEALWARRTYATTGERIILNVRVDGHMMGEECTASGAPEISVKVHGTRPLHAVEVMRGRDTIYRHPFAEPKGGDRLIKVEWMGARVRSRPKRVNWDGGLYIDKGRIKSHTAYSFDYPDQGVRRVTDQRLEWRSTTGGDSDGVILDLDAPKDAQVTFHSQQVGFRFRPSEVTYEPTVIEVGPVNRRVQVQAISAGPLPSSLEFTIRDADIHGGVNPYWVKVTQSNGALAWSSPVYVERRS
jgi:hypothetical protein